MSVQYLATFFFILSILHTFSVSFFNRLARRCQKGSGKEVFFHLMGEVEIVFGFWSLFFIIGYVYLRGPTEAIGYLNSRNYTEPLFVFVIMTVCSSKPVKDFVNSVVALLMKVSFFRPQVIFFFLAFTVVPLLGSFITEPAAMAITAALILEVIFQRNKVAESFKYAMLGLLFVNISIGGTLTSYAAPPVLMVAQPWGWDTLFMLSHFGWKSALACFTSTFLYFLNYKKSVLAFHIDVASKKRSPFWLQLMCMAFVGLIVLWHTIPVVFIGLFILFLGVYKVTQEYQDQLKVKESMLVGFFLAGLVILGGQQSWWLAPVVSSLNSFELFISAIGLTAFTDNAAITYLGTLVTDLSSEAKYALVAGAVIGGGLTVIANAPNPAGYGILNHQFGSSGIKASRLFIGALMPTLVAATIFWLF